MNPLVTCFLVDLYGDMKVIQDRLNTFLKEHHMALDPTTEAKLQELTTALTDELTEIKQIVTDGNNPTEINNRIDSVITAVKAMSDNLTTPAPGG